MTGYPTLNGTPGDPGPADPSAGAGRRDAVLLAEAEWELTAPAAIGAPERGETSATARLRQVARDGWADSEQPWIPATSLAGSLRAHLGPDLGPLLMGDEPQDEDDETAGAASGSTTGGTGHASVVCILGTELHLPQGRSTFDRTRTAIDAHRGATVSGMLATLEYLPVGTRVLCRLRVDGGEHHADVLNALITWHPILGGGRSTGHGTTRTLAIRSAVVDLATAKGRRLWLTHGGPELFRAAALEPVPVPETDAAPPDLLLPALRWQIVDALHLGSGERRLDEPALLIRDDQHRPYVPGTTWKGLLRSRSGYILRSLDLPACTGLTDTCGSCDQCTAFGWSGDDATGARARLRFHDTAITQARTAERQHVAIDRFTGGAADGLLFTDEVIETGEFTLAIGTEGEVPALARAALVLALWDLHTGLVGLGGGTTRGYGTIRCAPGNDTAVLESLRDEALTIVGTHHRETA
ncbi:RAMP superfamily CRISPR-associated protein [Streptomyces sp. NPDC001680]